MGKVNKKYLTFNKIRLNLFIHSYSFYRIAYFLKTKYKIDDKLGQTKLLEIFSRRSAVPEISKLAKALNLNYKTLWKMIFSNTVLSLDKSILKKDKIRVYIAIESELILLARTKNNRSDYKDPDYEEGSALLSLAIERASGNSLRKISDDLVFSKQLEDLRRKYIYWYYKIAYKYKLPTSRITPFLLRLIS